jgi:poly-gamma-glutamate capsule biosynthesis protein CapA/YwtB (metallophosphatase superfamily)
MPRASKDPTGLQIGYLTLFAALCAALVLYVVALSELLRTPFSTPIRFVDNPLFQPPAPPPGPQDTRGETTIRLAFSGDIMQHREQMADSFADSYEGLRPLLSHSDLVVGNLQFPVGPEKPVGPPPLSVRFNGSPSHLAALRQVGFDVLVTANNHAFDEGLEGALRTREQVQKAGMLAVGTGASWQQAGPLLLDVKGIPGAIAAYTFRPNSYPDEDGKIRYWELSWPIYELNFQDWTEEYRQEGLRVFREHADLARRNGARILVAFIHWGEEWHFQPTEDQRLAGRDMIDAGFDLVVGSHSHVLNPAEIYRGRLIAYSLGNLISAFHPLEVRTSALLEVDLGLPEIGAPNLRGYRFRPTVTERENEDGASFRVVPLSENGPGEQVRALGFARRILGTRAVVAFRKGE